jgi:hypothetical protein
MSMLAMRLGFDRAGASAFRLSIAAAMVITEPVYRELFTFFALGGPLQRNVNKG